MTAIISISTPPLTALMPPMPQLTCSLSHRVHPRDVKSYLLQQAQRIGREQADGCSRTLLVQVWHEEKCFMESQVVECGKSAQTNDCPLPGAEGLTLNKVEALAAPFAATPTAPPTGYSHGPSASAVVAILAVVILFMSIVGLFLWDCLKRKRARREQHESATIQTVVIRLDDGRSSHEFVPFSGGPEAQPNVQRGSRMAESIAYLPDGLRMPRRPEAAAGTPSADGHRRPEPQVRHRDSEETIRTLVASGGQIRSIASETTLRDTEAEHGSSETVGRTATSGGSSIASETTMNSTGAGYYSSETEGGTSSSGRSRLPLLDDIAGYRSWRSAG